MGKRKLLALGLGAWAIRQAAFTGAMLHVERGEAFCVACHLHEVKRREMMRPAGQTGQLSSRHFEEGIGCADCHREPGPLGRVVTLYTLGVRDTVRYLFTDFREPERLTVDLEVLSGVAVFSEVFTFVGEGVGRFPWVEMRARESRGVRVNLTREGGLRDLVPLLACSASGAATLGENCRQEDHDRWKKANSHGNSTKRE